MTASYGIYVSLDVPLMYPCRVIHSARVLARPFYWTALFSFAHMHSKMAVPVGRTGLRCAVQVFEK